MIIRNKQERKTYKEACQLSTKILRQLYEAVEIGVEPIELDRLAFKLCREWDVSPSFFGVQGRYGKYEHATCIQINDAVVHGVPQTNYKIKSGDLVTVDFGLIYEGFYTDHAFSVGIGQVSQANLQLLQCGKEAVLAAVSLTKVGATSGDLGNAMITIAQENGFETAKEYVGHGIGHKLHGYPELPSFGTKGKGDHLEKGMVVCVECQVLAGSDKLKTDPDGWTVRTKDGGNAVMFEYMVEVGKNGPRILTDTRDWELVKM